MNPRLVGRLSLAAIVASRRASERPSRPSGRSASSDGGLDVFGDGSVTTISTPGHTLGHQSLLVHLPKTGWAVLSGDLTHFKDNWDNRHVASMNTSAEQTQASFKRVADLIAEKRPGWGSITTSLKA